MSHPPSHNSAHAAGGHNSVTLSPAHAALIEAKRKQTLLIRFAVVILGIQAVVVTSSIVGLSLQDPSVKAMLGKDGGEAVAAEGGAADKEAGHSGGEKAAPASKASEEELAQKSEGKEGHKGGKEGEKAEGGGHGKEKAETATASKGKSSAELYEGMGVSAELNPIESAFLDEKDLKIYKRLGFK